MNKNLTLIGRSHHQEFYKTQLGSLLLTDGSSGSTIRGFAIPGGIVTSWENISESISNITIRDNYLNQIRLGSSSDPADVMITNTTIIGNYIYNGMHLAANVSSTTVQNNYFTYMNSSSDVEIANPESTTITNCIFKLDQAILINTSINNTLNVRDCMFFSNQSFAIAGNYQFNNSLIVNLQDPTNPVEIQDNDAAIKNVTNCIFGEDPLIVSDGSFEFGNFMIPDFSVMPGSPAIGAGINGGYIGFSEGFDFKYVDGPSGTPQIRVLNYTSGTPENGTLTFTIEAKSN